MKDRFFRVIIPTYNGGQFLPRMVDCIKRQTFTDYHLVIVDDLSTDDTWDIVKSLKPDKAVQVDVKGYAAGARNKGMEFYKGDTYTMWFDDDDILIDENVFQRIHDNAVAHDLPDVIRLNYIKTKLSTGLRGNHHDRYSDDITPADICLDIMGGMPWSKTVKTEKCVEFPLGLVIDDCFQHICQMDVCETASAVQEDCYEWLVREGSCTTNHRNVMYRSGWYLEVALLMRKKDSLIHEWAQEAIERRIAWIKRHHLRGDL